MPLLAFVSRQMIQLDTAPKQLTRSHFAITSTDALCQNRSRVTDQVLLDGYTIHLDFLPCSPRSDLRLRLARSLMIHHGSRWSISMLCGFAQVGFHRFQAYAAAEIAPTSDNCCSKPPQQICQGVLFPVAETILRVEVQILQLPVATKKYWHQLWLTFRGEIYVTVVYCCKILWALAISVDPWLHCPGIISTEGEAGAYAKSWLNFIFFSSHSLLLGPGRTLGLVTALLLRPSLSTGPDCHPTGCIHILVARGKSALAIDIFVHTCICIKNVYV